MICICNDPEGDTAEKGVRLTGSAHGRPVDNIVRIIPE
jgi:hypothetical protein